MKTFRKLATLIALGTAFHGMSVEGRTRPAVSADAAEATENIGDALRELRDYKVEMEVSTRAALGGGKYRDFSGTVHYVVRPPDHLFARIEGKGVDREVFYDGEAITVYAPAQRKYARIEAPGDIRTLLESAKARKGIELPIADLFAWGTPGGPMSNPARGVYSGTRLIHKRACKHYSYKQATIAWEVWVDDVHLPCKLVVVDTADAGLPGYTAEFSWGTTQSTDDVFRFTPQESVKKVELSEIADSDPVLGEGAGTED